MSFSPSPSEDGGVGDGNDKELLCSASLAAKMLKTQLKEFKLMKQRSTIKKIKVSN